MSLLCYSASSVNQQSETVGHLSDKFNLRGPFIIGGCIVSLVGYIILVTETSPAIGYVGAIMATIGIFPTVAINMAWVGSAAGGELRKGASSVFLLLRCGLKVCLRSYFCYG